MNDSELIKNYLDGDIRSFNRLVDRWDRRLFSFAYRYLLDEEDAKDVVQATFIKVYKNVKKLKNREKFSSWVYQIAVNLCKDVLKSSHKNRMMVESSHSNGDEAIGQFRLDNLSNDSDTSASMNREDLGRIVRQTMAKLPEEQRVVIIMKEYDGFKFSEIAEILECPVNTVKARMYYGLKQMHKILKNMDIDGELNEAY